MFPSAQPAPVWRSCDLRILYFLNISYAEVMWPWNFCSRERVNRCTAAIASVKAAQHVGPRQSMPAPSRSPGPAGKSVKIHSNSTVNRNSSSSRAHWRPAGHSPAIWPHFKRHMVERKISFHWKYSFVSQHPASIRKSTRHQNAASLNYVHWVRGALFKDKRGAKKLEIWVEERRQPPSRPS